MRKFTILPFYLILALSFLALGLRLTQLQIIDGQIYQTQAEDNRIRTVYTDADRGVVFDRNLRQLITNQPAYSVEITEAGLPEDADAQKAVFARLAALLNTSPVLTIVPDDLFANATKAETTIEQLAAALGMTTDLLREKIDAARATSPAAPNLIRDELDAPTAAALTARLGDWPGVAVMDELQYTFITRRERAFNPVTVKRNIIYNTMVRIEEMKLDLPGVSILAEPVRQYNEGIYLSHIIGYMGAIPLDQYTASLPIEGSGEMATYDKNDKIGLDGIEQSMEEALRGQKGERVIEVDSAQHEVREILSQPPTDGNNVVLTIDSALQISVTNALQEGIDEAHSKTLGQTGAIAAGVAIVQKVDTGEILAMVSLPSYDDNLFASGISQQDLDMLNNNPNLPMYSRAISGRYPPGSTFKLITAAAGLQEGVVTTSTQMYDGGYIDVPLSYDENQRTRFNGWNKNGLGWLNITQAIQRSCDICFYEVAAPAQEDVLGNATHYYNPGDRTPYFFSGLGLDRLRKYMLDFGLGERSGIELPGEDPGLAPDRDWKLANFPTNNWSLGDTITLGIGQSYTLATPLQISNMTATVANGGTLYRPQIVSQVLASDGGTVREQRQPQVIRQVPVDPAYLAVVREGMRLAVSDHTKGTAKATDLAGVQIAGKTGTAEIGEELIKQDGTKYRNAHAWFTAFAPYENPEIAVTVLIEAGDESLEGSTFAVPVARHIFEAYFHLENEN